MKKMAALISTALVTTGMLAGCGAKQEQTAESPSKVSTSSSQMETEPEKKDEIRTEEISFKNGEKNIYGMIESWVLA